MIDRDDIPKLRMLLSSSGWNDVIKPAVENRIRQHIKALVLHPSERQVEDDDNALRVRIQELEWLLAAFINACNVAAHNEALDELQGGSANGMEPIGVDNTANP